MFKSLSLVGPLTGPSTWFPNRLAKWGIDDLAGAEVLEELVGARQVNRMRSKAGVPEQQLRFVVTQSQHRAVFRQHRIDLSGDFWSPDSTL